MPINKKMILIFSFVMIVTIMMIRLFVATLFQRSFERYVDDSNKVELYHLMNFDARGLYRNNEWDMEFIKDLGIDAIQKGIAIKVYDYSNQELWSVFSDEKVLSDYTLNEISQNMQNIDSDWSNALEDYQVDIYNERDEVVGKLDLTHYASTYYMSNDLELLNTVNQVILIIGIVSVGSIVVVSAMISKSISIPIVKVSRMAKLIETGQYKKEVETRSDIKEIDELIASINNLSLALDEQEMLRKQLTTDIAHELRTPLTTIKGHLDVMIAGIWEPTPERLVSINEEVVRISRMVDELRHLSKYDSERTKLELSNIRLDELLESIIYNYQVQAFEKNIEIHSQIEPVMALVDEKKFSQVLINLLSNAIKYTNVGGVITVTCQSDEKDIYIKVSDSGIGIPDVDLKHIFERFYRVDKSRSKETGGIGVGLTIAKSIVEAHGGVITVSSKLGVGSEFMIQLPVV